LSGIRGARDILLGEEEVDDLTDLGADGFALEGAGLIEPVLRRVQDRNIHVLATGALGDGGAAHRSVGVHHDFRDDAAFLAGFSGLGWVGDRAGDRDWFGF